MLTILRGKWQAGAPASDQSVENACPQGAREAYELSIIAVEKPPYSVGAPFGGLCELPLLPARTTVLSAAGLATWSRIPPHVRHRLRGATGRRSA